MKNKKQIVLSHKNWLRLVYSNNKYSIEVKHWFNWIRVLIGPFGVSYQGLPFFEIRRIAIINFIKCSSKGKKYTKQFLR